MAMKRRPSRRRVNPKFYIFIGVIAVAAFAIVFFLTYLPTAVVEQGAIPFETTVPAVIVRDEQVIATPNYGKVEYTASEGERVEEQTPVADVYKWGYNGQVMNDLVEIQTKIEQYQENELQKAGGNETLNDHNAKISVKTEEIVQIIGGNGEGNILTAEKELNTLLAEKQQFLRDAVQPDQQLQTYYDTETQLKTRVDEWRQVMTAPSAGVVSFYFDGLEEALNASKIKDITSADILGVLNGTTQKQPAEATGEGAEKQIYRLVNSYKWYLVVRSEKEIQEFANDNVFSIAFDDYIAKQYQGTVVGTVKEEGDCIYAIEIDDDIGELLNVRRVDAKVYTQFEGLKVPKKAIKEQNGVTGVNVVTGREKTFVPVTVKIQRDDNAIVVPVEENSPLMANQHVEV